MNVREDFLEIVKEIQENRDKEFEMSPRDFLSYFHCEKRTKGNNKINPRWSLFAFQNQLGYRLGDIVHLDTIDIASYCWSILCRSMLGHRAYIDFSCLLCVTIC